MLWMSGKLYPALGPVEIAHTWLQVANSDPGGIGMSRWSGLVSISNP